KDVLDSLLKLYEVTRGNPANPLVYRITWGERPSGVFMFHAAQPELSRPVNKISSARTFLKELQQLPKNLQEKFKGEGVAYSDLPFPMQKAVKELIMSMQQGSVSQIGSISTDDPSGATFRLTFQQTTKNHTYFLWIGSEKDGWINLFFRDPSMKENGTSGQPP